MKDLFINSELVERRNRLHTDLEKQDSHKDTDIRFADFLAQPAAQSAQSDTHFQRDAQSQSHDEFFKADYGAQTYAQDIAPESYQTYDEEEDYQTDDEPAETSSDKGDYDDGDEDAAIKDAQKPVHDNQETATNDRGGQGHAKTAPVLDEGLKPEATSQNDKVGAGEATKTADEAAKGETVKIITQATKSETVTVSVEGEGQIDSPELANIANQRLTGAVEAQNANQSLAGAPQPNADSQGQNILQNSQPVKGVNARAITEQQAQAQAENKAGQTITLDRQNLQTQQADKSLEGKNINQGQKPTVNGQVEVQTAAPTVKVVKNIGEPLRVKGDALLHSQEVSKESGSLVLETLKSELKVNGDKVTDNKTGQNAQSAASLVTANGQKTHSAITGQNADGATDNAQNAPRADTRNSQGDGHGRQSSDGSQSQQQSSQNAQAANGQAQSDTTASVQSKFSQQLGGQQSQTSKAIHAQIRTQIQRAVKEGVQRINIQLRPLELGRVDVQIDKAADGKITLTIAPEKIDTLELLQRDSSSLQQSLQNAGLDVGKESLTFLLRQEFAGRGNQKNDDNNKKLAANDEGQEQPDGEQLDDNIIISDDGRVNVKI